MITTTCDFCGKQIKSTIDKVTVTVEPEAAKIGWMNSGEYHFHVECITRVINKVTEFAKQQQKTK